jgi:hypothetical protein
MNVGLEIAAGTIRDNASDMAFALASEVSFTALAEMKSTCGEDFTAFCKLVEPDFINPT